MYLHKEGVCLCKAELSDVEFLHDLKCENWWGTHKTIVLSRQDTCNWFSNLPSSTLVMIAKQDYRRIGVALYQDIDPIARTANVSGAVLKEKRGELSFSAFKAGVDFAFEILNLNRLNAEVSETHAGALKLETNVLGFQVEGRKRKAIYKCGQYYDSIVIGLLREEWQTQTRVLGYGGVCNKNFDLEKAEFSSQVSRKVIG